MNFSGSNGPSFHLYEQYFLETQNSSTQAETIPHYKVILKHGLYYKTIQRDLVFNGKLDSVKLIEIVKTERMIIRGYTSKTTFVSNDVDSIEVMVKLKTYRPGDVEYHL